MNLADATERNELMQSELERVGLDAERIESVDGRKYIEGTNGEQIQVMQFNEHGVNTTYVALIDTLLSAFYRAKDEGWKSFLILEDDAEFMPDFEAVLDSVFERKTRMITVDDLDKPIVQCDPLTGEAIEGAELMYEKEEVEQEYSDLPDNWCMLTLGCVNGQYASKQIGGRVHKLRQFTLGTAIAFSESIYDLCIEKLESRNAPSDVIFSNICFDNLSTVMTCGIRQGIVTQRAGFSSCIGRDVPSKEVS